MRFWAFRTNKGRVVYDRKKHPFTWRDVLRIILKAPPWWIRYKERDPFPWFLILLIHTMQLIRDLKMNPPDVPFDPPTGEIIDCVDQVDVFLRAWFSLYENQYPDWSKWGGGEFGGGGATRPIDDPECWATQPPGASPFDIGPCGFAWVIMPFQGHCCPDTDEKQ